MYVQLETERDREREMINDPKIKLVTIKLVVNRTTHI